MRLDNDPGNSYTSGCLLSLTNADARAGGECGHGTRLSEDKTNHVYALQFVRMFSVIH